jgi:hypothetical protein
VIDIDQFIKFSHFCFREISDLKPMFPQDGNKMPLLLSAAAMPNLVVMEILSFLAA